jgi:putative sterol carrier protein
VVESRRERFCEHRRAASRARRFVVLASLIAVATVVNPSGRRRDPTDAFFADLAERGAEPLLREASGAMRFDIVSGRTTKRWLVSVDDGALAVTEGGRDATCVIRVDKRVFDKIASGRLNAVAAVLRGDVHVAGDWRMLVRLQRLFPSPPRRRSRAAR